MMGQYFSGLIVLCIAACTAEPRSTEFFEEHPEDAVQVTAMCATGTKGGDECINARAGIVEMERHARMEAYKRQLEDERAR